MEEMKHQSDQFRKMIDEIPTLAWSCLPDGSGEFLNKRWLDYTGLSMEAALGWHWQAVIHPEDLETLMNTWRRHLASGEPGEVEARLRRFDGAHRFDQGRNEGSPIANRIRLEGSESGGREYRTLPNFLSGHGHRTLALFALRARMDHERAPG